ncbi:MULTISPECIES: hypothetical protein [unclassified Methylobacterium]|uniref:hypothetical protein n=1 Tax=unclassified Methylobacterium TaxID=2615210 RepID=UPI0011C89AF3|nr:MULTISPECIES: hypothetical protein [unclassified Methylobacterium]TXM63692.1 hypothetical protein FV229_21500 [Methylobacterium sp. WL120]
MRLAALAVIGALVAAPALAQDAGNVGQPSRAVPQAGQTTGGPRDVAPGADGAATTGSTVTRPAGEMGMAPGADSAKGGNVDQTNKMTPNAGGTAGGPAR